MGIELKQKHLGNPIWLRDLEEGEAFVTVDDGTVYLCLSGSSGRNIRCFSLRKPGISYLFEETCVLKVNLNIEWTLQC